MPRQSNTFVLRRSRHERRVYFTAKLETGLTPEEISDALLQSLAGRSLKKVLILPPDFTRFHSNAGFITNVYYHALTERDVQVDILPALGTHVPMTEPQWKTMICSLYERQ